MCPAMKLANNMMFLYLTNLVRKFEFSPAPGVNYSQMEPVLGITVGLKPFKLILNSRNLSACG